MMVMPELTFQSNLCCYLWDLVDHGIDDALDRIQGETGVTGLVIDLHCPPLEQIRPYPGVLPRTFRTQGGAQFQSEPVCYAGTRIRPVVADWLRKRNPLKSVVDACRQRGFRVGGRLTACEHPVIALRHETAAVRDVFGDRSTRRICPINPDVAEYFRGLVDDLNANYGLDSLRIGQLGFAPIHERPQCGFSLGPIESWLWSLCFCESCRQLASRDGIDMDAVSKRVSATLEQALQTGSCSNDMPEAFAERHPELGAFLEWRSQQMHNCMIALRRACRCTLLVEEHAPSIHSGLDVRAVAHAYDAYSIACDPGDGGAQAVERAVRDALAVCEQPARLALRLDAGQGCPDHDVLVAAVVQAARMGCHSVDIGNYGLLPPVRLEWIRQAVRFAHREAM